MTSHIVPDLGHHKLTYLGPLLIEQAEASWLRQGNRRTGGPLDPQTVLHTHRVLHAAMERAVRWRDVDLDSGVLRVTQNVHRIRQHEGTDHMGQKVYGFRFGPAKTHRSKRPVSMPAVVVELLRVHRSQQAAARLQVGAVWTDLDLVFTDARGYPHNHDRVRRVFYTALDAAGGRQVVLYALRHTMATLVLHETKDLKLVATRLGHSNEMLVLRTYGHLLPGVDREAADRLGEVVKRRRQGD